jgi:hypothetical protein
VQAIEQHIAPGYESVSYRYFKMAWINKARLFKMHCNLKRW